MTRRPVILTLTLGLALLIDADVVGDRVRPEQRPLTASGRVYMVTSPDGLTTAVTLDVGSWENPPDGIVDDAFRLQHGEVWQAAFDGWASITYDGTELRIAVRNQSGWSFTLDGAVPNTQPVVGYATFTVFGLSHHWGTAVQEPAEQVAAALLPSGCTIARGDPLCETCEAGGPGVEGCAVDCGGGSGCSANCASGTFACCNCPGGCRCCKNIQGPPRASR